MSELTYSPAGGTKYMLDGDAAPSGYHAVEHRVRLGSGEELFHRAGAAVLEWQIQRGSGMRVDAEATARVGSSVTCYPGVGPFRLRIPCRVVWVEQTDSLIGFGYGTLPGHPERGEEGFAVELSDTGEVYFHVVAYSRQAWPIFRLLPFLGSLAQNVTTRAYLRAARGLR